MDSEFLTVAQLGALVGLKSQAAHDLIRRARIPRYPLSKRCIRVKRSDVDTYLERVKVAESR